MPDDIQIKSTGHYGSGGQSTGGSSASSGSGQGQIPNTDDAPMIDLSQLDVSIPDGTETEKSLPTLPPQQAEQNQPVPQKSTNGFDLEAAAMMSTNQGVAAPPEKYQIPDMVKEKFPDLVDLIKSTESMNDDERDYWFQILPIMTEEQIKKFRDILLNEKVQLQSLDKEYEQELTTLNEKHMIEWKEFESKEKRTAIKQAESAAQQQEQVTEEELLNRLSDM